jgi:nicotinamidase-related amidase
MSEKGKGLRYGPLGEGTVHLCVDMQRMFDADTPWATGWLRQVLPKIVQLCEAHSPSTVFTRFIPASSSNDAPGAWRRYYKHWEQMTLRRIDRNLVELVPELGIFVPPATVLDKRTYSPWAGTDLLASLRSHRVDTIVVSGGETDICVLSTVLGAVDAGFRVVVATDALCSSVNDAHDGIMDFYYQRLGEQIEAAEVDEIIDGWKAGISAPG